MSKVFGMLFVCISIIRADGGDDDDDDEKKGRAQQPTNGFNVMTSFGNGFKMIYDPASAKVKMTVAVKSGTWLGVGFGTGMRNTAMITFEGKDGGNCLDQYSTQKTVPTLDDSQDVSCIVT